MNLMQDDVVRLVVKGKLLSKSNSRRVVKIGGKPRLIKSHAALEYVQDAIPQIQSQLGRRPAFEEPVSMTITVYYQDRRPDLDVSLIQDVMEKAGVYLNDRQVYEIHAYKQFDKENPRCEVEVALM